MICYPIIYPFELERLESEPSVLCSCVHRKRLVEACCTLPFKILLNPNQCWSMSTEHPLLPQHCLTVRVMKVVVFVEVSVRICNHCCRIRTLPLLLQREYRPFLLRQRTEVDKPFALPLFLLLLLNVRPYQTSRVDGATMMLSPIKECDDSHHQQAIVNLLL